MQCDDQSSSNSLQDNPEIDEINPDQVSSVDAILPQTDGNSKVSLTQLWEHVVKNKKLPDNIDTEFFFTLVTQKLRNPEWEVRQHSLRVLVDIIPIIEAEELDSNIEEVLNEIVRNLGHIGPAVRKAAVDALKVYVNNTKKPNLILRELVHKGVEQAALNKVNPNITLGIIIAIPFLISSKISIDALRFVVHVLLEKLENILHQESIVRSLLRIKGIIGKRRFEEILEAHKSRKDFEMLCELYNFPEPTICDFIPDVYENKPVWSDYNQNLVGAQRDANLEVTTNTTVDGDKVILETEIKLQEGPAITMKIHEEARENSFFDSSDSDCEHRGISTFQVLADDSDDDFESLRKTPRRVRFGGEIVKMRTPDSDSNHQSDEADDKLTKCKPLLEIYYKKTTKLPKSHIPVPVCSRNCPNSEPNSPKRVKSTKLYKSSPNLSTEHGKKSKIPQKKDYRQKEVTKSLKIKVNNVSSKNTRKEVHPKKIEKMSKNVGIRFINTKIETKVKSKERKIPALEYKPQKETEAKDEQKSTPIRNLSPPKKTNRNMERFSPIPIHNEIEVFHNLTRSPERTPKREEEEKLYEERRLMTADGILLEKTPNVNERKIHTADSVEKTSTINQMVFINNYNSFHIYNCNGNSRLEDFDSPIPTIDTGECLTCSSSGSEVTNERMISERIGLLDERILHDIQVRNDIATKKRGLEELLKALKDPNVLESISEKLTSLLNILFSAEQQPILQSISEQTLSYIFANAAEEMVMEKMQPIAYNLCKTGSPVGVRLALGILKRVQAKYFVECLLNDSIIEAKSSKIREGTLQILMTISRIFPSTEMDIPKCLNSVVKMLKDKKKRVRQAALETIASLTQLSSTSIVLDVATNIIQNYPDKDHLLRVIRTRLSRKQLPAVDLNGNVRYSTPVGNTELDFLSNLTDGFFEEQRINENCAEKKHESSSGEKTNYWKQKKQFGDENDRVLDNIDWDSHEHRDETLNKNLQTQIWAIDPGTLYSNSDKVNQVNGSLRPVFVIQPDSSQSCDSYTNGTTRSHKQTNTDHEDFRPARGRSFSPPKKLYDSSLDNSIENERFYKTDDSPHKFYTQDKFHKSYSSDQLVPSQKGYLGQSGSSSTSGSSMRSNGAWRKDVRSGIPIPINTDNRFKFRTKQSEFKGPLSSVQYYNPKFQSPDSTPDKFSAQTRPVMARQPFSSGSESSGYFTPPAEPHLPDIFDQNADIPSRSKSSQSGRFVRVDTPSIHHENFTIIDSNYCESLKSKSAPVQHYPSFDSVDFEPAREFGEVIERVSSVEEEEEEDKSKDSVKEEQVIEEYQEKKILRRESTVNSLEDLDFVANQTFGERKLISKSEADILSATGMARKTINSAPTTNKTYEHFKTFDDTPISSTKTSLPGSIVDFQEIEVVQQVIEKGPTVCTKKITRQLSRKRSIKTIKQPEENFSTPFAKPKESLTETLNQLDSPEWEVTMRGLQNVVRLIRHHQTIVESNLHSICVGLGKHIKNLRSQVARSACSAASELFKTCKKAVEVEIEELATPLLHRTADTNKFLRSDANAALDDMSANLSPPKVVAVVTSRGSVHQNAIVRCSSVRLLCALCHRLGPEKIFQLPKDTRDKILLTGANMLTEGSLETRKHAKMLLGHLSGHRQFHKAMMEAVPSHIMRHISKSLKTLM